MAIRISKADANNYEAWVTPPHGSGTTWHTSGPVSVDELIEQLRGLGCHTTDIGDAFFEADPNWLDQRPHDQVRGSG